MKHGLSFYFVVGNQAKSAVFEEEKKQYDDFVVGDFVDDYGNLTLKTLTAHHFLNSEYFNSCVPKWAVFQDDDAFVDYIKVKQQYSYPVDNL